MSSHIIFTVLILCFNINILNANIKEVSVCRGQNVTLKWKVSDLKYHTFIYWKEGQNVIGKFIPPNYMNMAPEFSEYSSVINKSGDMVDLHILRVSLSNIGTYQCIVSFSNGKPGFHEAQILSLKAPIDGCDVTKKKNNSTCLTLHCDSTEIYMYIKGRFAERVSDKTYMMCNNDDNETVSCTDLPSFCNLCNETSSVKSNNTVDNGNSAVAHETIEELVVIIVGVIIGVIVLAVITFIGWRKAFRRRHEPPFHETKQLVVVTQPDKVAL